MALSRVVVTGKIGPGNTLTATTINDVKSVEIDFVNQVINIVPGTNSRPPAQVDIAADTTLTLTVSAGVYTLTLAA